ncbi:MAG: polyphosphate kinase 2 family protein [Chloroflexi bacterium]|nr:polyphosphate kinase 2 family protein [Chloroflexota bacterium]
MIVPPPLSKVNLKDFDPNDNGNMERDAAEAAVDQLRDELSVLQEKLYASNEKSLLLVFQAMDAGGKDGTIKKVLSGINPQGVHVTSFKAPTSEELAHDFLWRIHAHTPAKGYISVFNRNHYEDVLVVRVDKLAPELVWRERYDHINNFEKFLYDSGTRILKFYLHIDKDEQKERFQKRLDDPEKHWKFDIADMRKREQWDEYMKAYEDMLSKCNTEYAPWHIVPANRKWYRNLVVMQAIVETMRDMDLHYPEPQTGLDKVVIPD